MAIVRMPEKGSTRAKMGAANARIPRCGTGVIALENERRFRTTNGILPVESRPEGVPLACSGIPINKCVISSDQSMPIQFPKEEFRGAVRGMSFGNDVERHDQEMCVIPCIILRSLHAFIILYFPRTVCHKTLPL